MREEIDLSIGILRTVEAKGTLGPSIVLMGIVGGQVLQVATGTQNLGTSVSGDVIGCGVLAVRASSCARVFGQEWPTVRNL